MIKEMNFLLTEMSAFRYLMPLIIEGSKREIKSKLFIKKNSKYNNVYAYLDVLKKQSKKYNFEIYKIEEVSQHPGLTFMVEGCGLEHLDDSHRKITFTYMSDFCILHQQYIDKVDNVILPSKFFAEYYDKPRLYMDGQEIGNTISDKNLYLGSPKYDLELDAQSIKKKYNLSDNKKALVIFPKLEYVHRSYISKIYTFLKEMGYEIIVKARGKDPVPSDLMADKCFQDYSWYPHSTIELIEVCDFVVNFGSTVIKECILQHKPVVNFESKPYKHFEFMFQHEYCKELNFKVEYEGFKNAVEEVMNCPKEIYDVAIKKYLFEKSGTCARILDYLEST